MKKMILKDRLLKIRGKVLIYGAHLVALECCRFLIASGKGKNIVGFAVTDKTGNPTELEGFQVKEIEEYKERTDIGTVIIAMPEKYHTDVEKYTKRKGFKESIKIGAEAMSILKGEQLLLEREKHPELKFVLEKDDQDKSWLNIIENFKDTNRHYKFPTLFYRNIDDVLKETEKAQLRKLYQESLGEYRSLEKISKKCFQGTEPFITDIMKVFMVFSRGDSAKIYIDDHDLWICPLQVGGRDSEKTNFCLYDDIKDSITKKNALFAEMTGAYWIWKNINRVTYKGLCHYRRHFMISEDEIRALEQRKVDVILTTPRYVPFGIGSMFLAETPVKEPVFGAMLQAMRECVHEDARLFEDYLQTSFYYPNNMVIARNHIYNSYCEWIFKILFRMQEIEREANYGHENDRHIAYAAELLTSFYFAKNREVYRIAVTDYRFYA